MSAAVLGCWLILASSVWAELATVQEMADVSRNWVSQVVDQTGTWAGRTDAVIGDTHELYHNGVLVARYYDVQPRGYVLVPVLKEMTPVKMYSDESNLGPDQEGGVMAMVGELLYQRMDLYVQTYGSLDIPQPVTAEPLFDASHKLEWDRLAVSAREFRTEQALGTMAEGTPLLTSSWHQGAPYYNDCPMGDGGRCVVGCVATATAQILKFWEWPATGVGSNSYTWAGDYSCGGSTPAQALYADFSDGYDWANIPDDCNSGCNATQNAALAALNYEVGVAHNMDYGHCGSGAWTGRAAYVFPTFFKYKNTTAIHNRNEYTQQGWFDLIRSEIEAGRPMQYRINLHSIVCDGWREPSPGQLEFHMNYGWNDSHNAWYALDNLYCYWIDGDVCPYDEEYVITGIEPQHDPDLQLVSTSLADPAGNGNGYAEPGETVALTITVSNLGNDAANVNGVLSSSDAYVTVDVGSAVYAPVMVWGSQATNQTPFTITIAPGCPNPYYAELEIVVTADGGHSVSDTFLIYIGNDPGFEDDVESGAGYWSHFAPIPSYFDEWHIEDYRYHSGGFCWKMGGAGEADYTNSVDAALVSPPLLLPVDAKLTFWHRMSAEEEGLGSAWDGGAVFISENGGPWILILPQGGYSHEVTAASSISLGTGTPCYSGFIDWTEAVFDLSEFSGTVRIMFRFGSDGAVTDEGWYIDDVWIGNTLVGTNVEVELNDGVTVTFETVLTHGSTTATLSGEGPELASNYAPLPIGAPAYYDIVTGASFSGQVGVCMTYDPAGIGGEEANLKMLHYDAGQWTDVTNGVYPVADFVCGRAASLSPFVVAEITSCCQGRVGDANQIGGDEPTVADISTMIDMLFISTDEVACIPEADINQSGGVNPTRYDVTVADISVLIDYLFITGPTLGLNGCL